MGKCRWCWSILGYGDFTTQHLKKKTCFIFFLGEDRQTGWSLLICGVFFCGLDVWIYIYICIDTYTHILYIFAWKLFVLYFVEPFNPAFRRPKLEGQNRGQNRGQNKTHFWKIIDTGGDMWWTSQELKPFLVVSTHRTGPHPEQPLPISCKGNPFIVGARGIAWGVLQGCVVSFLDSLFRVLFFFCGFGGAGQVDYLPWKFSWMKRMFFLFGVFVWEMRPKTHAFS